MRHEGYSSPGTSNLKIICLWGYGPWRKFEAGYRAGNKAVYHREKDRWTDILIRRTEERLISGLGSMIEVKELGYYSGAGVAWHLGVTNACVTRAALQWRSY